jgi:phospholipase C
MKSTVKALALFSLSFTLLGAVLVHAQSSPGQFKHVIIVVQENRTPDNLFGGVPGTNGQPPFEPGADLAIAPPSAHNYNQGGQPWCLGACFDPGHANHAWQNQNGNGYPDTTNGTGCGQPQGSNKNPSVTYCSNYLGNPSQLQSVCNNNMGGADNWIGCSATYQYQNTLPNYPEESYVSYYWEQVYTRNSVQHVLDPYVQLATQYGFANYFYQTNQGPSEPAHDFLFGGTSAPTGDPTQLYYNWFDADNPDNSPVGCEGTTELELINPDGNVGYPNADPVYGGKVTVNPCFEHLTLSDLLEANGLTWQYYTGTPNGIWTAPNAIQHICLKSSTQPGNPCDNLDYTNNVKLPAQFFKDFPSGGTNLPSPEPCTLPSVAWITPDGANSDHPGPKNYTDGQFYSTEIEGGPNWVASIVNAVGQAKCYDVVNGNKISPWQDTAILIVWDDWGGWYDHIVQYTNGTKTWIPYQDNYLQLGQNTNDTCKPTSSYNPAYPWWGCGYTYGFRVPFLVVSAYTPAGTVSGGCTQTGNNPTCYPPNGDGSMNVAPHQHDFGSILAFVEYNFGLGIGCINLSGKGLDGIPCKNNPNGPPAGNYPFSDYYAPEVFAPGGPYTPLGDFFTSQAPRAFTPIPLVNNSFTYDYFYNFTGPYTDPDNDMIDND